MRTCAQVDCRVRNATSGVRGSAYMYWIDMATTHNCVIALAYLLLHHFYHSAFYAQIYLLFLRLSNINSNYAERVQLMVARDPFPEHNNSAHYIGNYYYLPCD